MFVVIVARGLPGPREPMLGIFEFDQARALADAGHKVVVAAIDVRSARRPRRHGVYRTNLDGLNVVVASLPLGAVGPRLTAAALEGGWRRAYRRIVADFGTPDIVHAHFNRFGAAAARLKPRAGYALVVTEHSWNWDRGLVKRAEAGVAREAYEAADAVIAVSPALAIEIGEHFDVPARYVPNILDTSAFASVIARRHEGIRLVSVGSLREIKRMELLVDTFAVALADEDVWLTIIGGGPLSARLAKRVTELGLKRVRLLGRLSRDRIAEEFATSDGFVLLSRRETFGVAYVEAMAAGLPVMAARSGGPEGFVVPPVGVLVDTDDRAELALDLRDFVDSLRGYDREFIRRYAVEQFSPEVVARQLAQVYAEVAPQS